MNSVPVAATPARPYAANVIVAATVFVAGVLAALLLAAFVHAQLSGIRGEAARNEASHPGNMLRRELGAIVEQIGSLAEVLGKLPTDSPALVQPLLEAALETRPALRTTAYAPLGTMTDGSVAASVSLRASQMLSNSVNPGEFIVDPVRRAIIQRAISTGETVGTPLLAPLADPTAPSAVGIYQAIYRGGTLPTTVGQRQERAAAILIFIIDAQELLDTIRRNLPATDADYYLFEASSGLPPGQLLGFDPAPSRQGQAALTLAALRDGRFVEQRMSIADRDWLLLLPTGGDARVDLLAPAAVAIAGVLLSAIAASGFGVRAGRRWRAEQLNQEVADVRTELAEQKTQQSDARKTLDIFASNLPAIFYRRQMNQDGVIGYPYLGGRLLPQLGMQPEQVQIDGHVFMDSVHPDDRDRYLAEIQRSARSSEPLDVHYRLQLRDRETLWVQSRATTRMLADGTVEWTGVVLDETEAYVARERALFVARHDPATGLLNSGAFAAALDELIASNTGFGLAIIDVPHLASVQDTYGLAVIDHVRAAIVERLRGLLPGDDRLAHAGQGQFMAVLPDLTEINQLHAMVKRIERLFDETFIVAGHEFPLYVCIGAARYPSNASTGGTLIAGAAGALAAARRVGHGAIKLYDGANDERDQGVLLVQAELSGALRRDEFVLYYQPQCATSDGRLVGMEALIRWQHPDKGLLLPGAFIAAAEASALIVPIGLKVLRMACAQQRAWLDAGRAIVPMSVNFAAPQLADPGLISNVRTILHEFAIPRGVIHIEITESLAVQDLAALIAFMTEMRADGVGFCIDDFGTGYTSLRFLTELRFDVIKIDRSFVTPLPGDVNSRAIIRGVVSMASELGLHVIAEGVETEDQFKALAELGCGAIQGYLKGRPMPAADMEPRLSMVGEQRPSI